MEAASVAERDAIVDGGESFFPTEAHQGGIVLRPAVLLTVENYTAQRKAEFRLQIPQISQTISELEGKLAS